MNPSPQAGIDLTPDVASRRDLPHLVASQRREPHLVATRRGGALDGSPRVATRVRGPIALPHLVASQRREPHLVATRWGGRSRVGRAGGAVAAAVLALGAALFGVATPASAEARVAIAVEGSTATDAAGLPLLSSDTPSTLTITGSGFQSVQGGFGGIYVLFGWVDPAGSWQPSLGGATGASYRYAMDDETNPEGHQQFVAFPGGATEASASSGVVSSDGSWSATIAVPGPVFETFDRENNAVQVDCLATQCGVITIGAHGVANANNETFTPVAFGSAAPAPAASPPQAAETATAEPAPITATDGATPSAVPADDVSAAVGSGGTAPVLIGIVVGVVATAAIITIVMLVVRRRRAPATPPQP